MKRLFLLYRQNIFTFLICFCLLSWALTSTFFAIRKTDKLILLKLTSDGVSTIDPMHAADDLIQVKAFLRRYVQLMYNYDYLSFEENVNKASFFLSDALWLKVKAEMAQVKKSIEASKLLETTAIEKISKLKDNMYELIVQTQISKTTGEARIAQNKKFKIKISVTEVARTIDNPWGMEVIDATEDNTL